MKIIFSLVAVLFVSGCGYSSVDNEMIGQVKKVVRNTPILCNEYHDADISLGVMRGGVGSMSTQDVWVYTDSKEDLAVLKKANENGALVKITYDVKRWTWCVDDHFVTKVELVK